MMKMVGGPTPRPPPTHINFVRGEAKYCFIVVTVVVFVILVVVDADVDVAASASYTV